MENFAWVWWLLAVLTVGGVATAAFLAWFIASLDPFSERHDTDAWG